jgi:hypothetical protein
MYAVDSNETSADSLTSDHSRSQPSVKIQPKIKYNTLPFANASEKRRLQTNALNIKLEILSRIPQKQNTGVKQYRIITINNSVQNISATDHLPHRGNK